MGILKIVDFEKYFPNSQNRRFGEIVYYFENYDFEKQSYYFEIVDYRDILMFTPALVLVIGGADEIYGVALL